MIEIEAKVGADPEIFLGDADGGLVSAYGLIKGDKEHPFPVTNGAVQVDGMAAEFNIDPDRDWETGFGRWSRSK